MTERGLLNVISMIYLAFVVALVFGINEHDMVKPILRATVRRWAKLLLALVAIGIIIYIWSSL
jgi:hypothetical protein